MSAYPSWPFSANETSHTVPEVNVYDRPGMPYALLLQLTGCDAPKTSPKSGSTTSDQLECLRNLEYTVLLKATLKIQGTLPFSRQISIWGPSYKSGSLIDRRPSERLASGHFLKIPMLIGTNKDEGNILFSALSGFHILDDYMIQKIINQKNNDSIAYPRNT